MNRFDMYVHGSRRQRIVYAFLPSVGPGVRKIMGVSTVLVGLSRFIFAPVIHLDFMPDPLYGALSILMGILLLATNDGWRSRWPGHVVAALAAGLYAAFALDLGPSTIGCWVFVTYCYACIGACGLRP